MNNQASTQPADPLRGVPGDDDLQALAERNAQRAKEAIRALGTRYLLHPANAEQRKTTPSPILQGWGPLNHLARQRHQS